MLILVAVDFDKSDENQGINHPLKGSKRKSLQQMNCKQMWNHI